MPGSRQTFPRRDRGLFPLVLTALVGGLLAGSPAPSSAQLSERDSSRIVERARDAQRDFERFRVSRIPVQRQGEAGRCDERIGRICIWFGGDDETNFPAEFREVGQARIELIRHLFEAFEQVKDPWILGQLVHYLVERRDMGEAERVAFDCGITEAWWCHALRGYTLHIWTQYVDAERAFEEALALMPPDVRESWTTPRYVFTRDAVEAFEDVPDAERDREWAMLWRLSDPLFLFEGNDRLTEHYARLVLARNQRDAAHPQGDRLQEDEAEAMIRYGMNIGYSRTQNQARTFGGLQDTRRVIGHHHPRSRGYLFPERFMEAPAEIPPESWITAPREARTWYAPPYAPDLEPLETQVARFRRGDDMRVVGAYRPVPLRGGEAPVFGSALPSTATAALFLVPEDGGAMRSVRGEDAEGVLVLDAPAGRYVSSLEVADVEERRAWRARQGVVQRPLAIGAVDVSDLLILRPGAPLPETLEEAVPHVRPGVRLFAGERFPVAWEVYGLGIRERVRVTVGFSRGRPGFLGRVGDFLGLIETERNVDITFDETSPDDRMQAVFRSIELELPDLDPGEYTLHLQLELPGRTPLVTSRPIIVMEQE